MTLYNLFPVGTTLPLEPAEDFNPVTVGTEFYVTESGLTVTQFRWWVPNNSTDWDPREGGLFTVAGDGTIAPIPSTNISFPAATASGVWCTVDLATPYPLTANQRYRVGIWHPNGLYPATPGYFRSIAEGNTLVQGAIVRPDEDEAIGNHQGSYVYNSQIDTPGNSFNGAGYFSDVTISHAGAGTTLSPSGIASAEAFGTAVATATLTAEPGGIVSGEALGTPAASTTLTATATAIETLESFGTPAATATLTATADGIVSEEAHGSPAASGSLTVSPGSIASAEALGTPAASASLTTSPSGIASAEAFGTPSAGGPTTASPGGIASGEAFGSPAVSGTLTVSPGGIGTSETFGTPVATGHVLAAATAIASLEVFGSPSASGAIAAPRGRDYAGSIPPSRYSGTYSNHRWDGSLG